MTSRKDKFAELYEHVCNDDEAKANELFHELVVEMARDIHNEMLSCEEGVHDDELEGDMENDLAHDLETVGGGHEEGHLEADAEEDLTNDLLGDEDMTMNGEEGPEGEEHPEPEGEEGPEGEEHEPEGEHFEVPAEVMHDADEKLKELEELFAEITGEMEGDEVKEGIEMSKVSVKMGGEQGGGHYAGTEVNVDSPFEKVDGHDVKLGGEPIEMGLGPKHTGFDLQKPTVTAKEFPKMVNRVKSAKEVMQKAGKEKGNYPENSKGEVGSGKSGMPIDKNPDGPISGKKKI